jgi:predicted Co/Zn/Cd cation transporter (cation efflux family)
LNQHMFVPIVSRLFNHTVHWIVCIYELLMYLKNIIEGYVKVYTIRIFYFLIAHISCHLMCIL